MIGTLIREQLRSQARYAAASFALVALATSLAAFLLVSIATSQRENARVVELTEGTTDNHAWITVWTNGEPTPRPADMAPATFTSAELDAALAELNSSGSAPQVRYQEFVRMEGDPIAHSLGAIDLVPPTSLAVGTAPGPGQVVVDAALAKAHGLAVGDQVHFGPSEGATPTVSLELSGILRPARWNAGPTPPRILASTDEGLKLINEAGFTATTNAAGERTALMVVVLSWDGAVPQSLEPLTDPTGNHPSYAAGPYASEATLACVLVIVTALLAGAVAGVSQGAARTRWIGTVRALGATRGNVMRAAVLEIGGVGIAAGALGVAAGTTANVVMIRRGGGTFAGDWPSLTAQAVAWSLALALAISLVLGAAPTYWAARSTPAAALSAVGPADEAPGRSRVSARTLTIACSMAILVLLAWAGLAGTGHGWTAVPFAVAVLGCASALCLLVGRSMDRLLAVIGGALGRRHNPVTVAAGVGLAQHPRRAVSIASSLFAGGLIAGALVWMWAARPDPTSDIPTVRPWNEAIVAAGLATVLTAGVIGAATTMVGFAVWIARGAIARDASVMGALGLGRRDRQLSALTQVGISAFAGGASGLLFGTLGAAITTTVLAWCGRATTPQSPAGVASGVQGVVVWLGALLGLALISAAVALVAARASDGKDPAALKRKANRAGVPT